MALCLAEEIEDGTPPLEHVWNDVSHDVISTLQRQIDLQKQQIEVLQQKVAQLLEHMGAQTKSNDDSVKIDGNNEESDEPLGKIVTPTDLVDPMSDQWFNDYADPGRLSTSYKHADQLEQRVADEVPHCVPNSPRHPAHHALLETHGFHLLTNLSSILRHEDRERAENIYTNANIDVVLSDFGLWGAVALEVAAPGICVGTSMLLMVLLMLNFTIEAVFCVCLFRYMIPGPVRDDIWQLTRWRETVAHSELYLDLNATSLVERVCKMDDSVSLAESKLTLLGQINNYLGDGDSGVPGMTLCAMSVLLWTLIVISDLRGIYTLRSAITALPTKAKGAAVSLLPTQISSLGRWLCSTIFGLRIVLSVVLLLLGCIWLGRTTDLQDLILNASALGFVLDLSNMLYTVTPRRFQNRMSAQPPLKLDIHGKPVDGMITITSVLAVLIAVMSLVAAPLVVDLKLAKIAMCGGDTNFVIGQNTEVGIAVYMETTPFDPSAVRSRSFLQRATREVVHLNEGENSLLALGMSMTEYHYYLEADAARSLVGVSALMCWWRAWT